MPRPHLLPLVLAVALACPAAPPLWAGERTPDLWAVPRDIPRLAAPFARCRAEFRPALARRCARNELAAYGDLVLALDAGARLEEVAACVAATPERMVDALACALEAVFTD